MRSQNHLRPARFYKVDIKKLTLPPCAHSPTQPVILTSPSRHPEAFCAEDTLPLFDFGFRAGLRRGRSVISTEVSPPSGNTQRRNLQLPLTGLSAALCRLGRE